MKEKINKLDGDSSIELKNRFTLKRRKVKEIERSNKILEDKKTELEKEKNISEKNIIKFNRDLKNIQNNIQNYSTERDKLKLDLQNLKEKLGKFDLDLIRNDTEKLKQKRDSLIENGQKSKEYYKLEKKFRRDREATMTKITKIESSISDIEINLSSVETTIQHLNTNLKEAQKVLEKAIEDSDFKELEEALSSIISQEKIEKYSEGP